MRRLSNAPDYINDALVDMDGVVADFDRYVLEHIPQHIARVARQNFYIHQDYPEYVDQVREVTSRPNFFHDLPVVDDALEGWQRMLDAGFGPRIASAPLSSNTFSVEGKRAWLKRHLVPHFGSKVVEQAIFDRNKYKYFAISLTDDRPRVPTNNGEAVWQHVVFDKPYNQDSDAKFRQYGWLDPKIPEILHEAQEIALRKSPH